MSKKGRNRRMEAPPAANGDGDGGHNGADGVRAGVATDLGAPGAEPSPPPPSPDDDLLRRIRNRAMAEEGRRLLDIDAAVAKVLGLSPCAQWGIDRKAGLLRPMCNHEPGRCFPLHVELIPGLNAAGRRGGPPPFSSDWNVAMQLRSVLVENSILLGAAADYMAHWMSQMSKEGAVDASPDTLALLAWFRTPPEVLCSALLHAVTVVMEQVGAAEGGSGGDGVAVSSGGVLVPAPPPLVRP